MLPRIEDLRVVLEHVNEDRAERGYEVEGFRERIAAAPESYDALAALHRELDAAPRRADWPYVEPEELDAIWAECPDLPADPVRPVDLDDARPAPAAPAPAPPRHDTQHRPAERGTAVAARRRHFDQLCWSVTVTVRSLPPVLYPLPLGRSNRTERLDVTFAVDRTVYW